MGGVVVEDIIVGGDGVGGVCLFWGGGVGWFWFCVVFLLFLLEYVNKMNRKIFILIN